ncbi:L-lactate dehydrogenase-like [Trichogramma pretiosum]|uniref:L-lactate dehydrogenase-like n=1 Tax=Trichogramma pretiosum TaxID=7493 RepID=UPI0006C9B818|nr:L-lactate dehydrogenase-like [Trichogramma pretiosum]
MPINRNTYGKTQIVEHLLAKQISGDSATGPKVAVLNAFRTGVSVSACLIFKGLVSELVLYDEDADLVEAEVEDLSHAAVFHGNPRIIPTNDLSDVKDALVCVLTCRCSNSAKDDEVQCKVNRVKLQVSKIKQYAPNCIIVIADEPVDLLSYVAWKTSEFESNKIIGVGTMLDNVRLRSLVANRLKNQIRASDVQSFVVGQAGCNSGKEIRALICRPWLCISFAVPVWSSASVMNTRLKDFNAFIGTSQDSEAWNEHYDKYVRDASSVLTAKLGYHGWGLAACACKIVDCVLRNTQSPLPVSTFMPGCNHGFSDKNVFVSLPCIIGRTGVLTIVKQRYTVEEQTKLEQACSKILASIKKFVPELMN